MNFENMRKLTKKEEQNLSKKDKDHIILRMFQDNKNIYEKILSGELLYDGPLFVCDLDEDDSRGLKNSDYVTVNSFDVV